MPTHGAMQHWQDEQERIRQEIEQKHKRYKEERQKKVAEKQQRKLRHKLQSDEQAYSKEGEFTSLFRFLLAFWIPGLIGSALTYWQVQIVYHFFDIHIAWELGCLVLTLIISYILGIFLIPIAITVGLFALLLYILGKMFFYFSS